ncbi:PD-(D/E)XK nuclease family protein [Paenibacillus ihuae]|uniref:PD-(D/E)XK nuclease family protein n=1 Tax=Paenibacillus ihuae TaxID=1232431 RepID=UPI0006D549CC|nr:PD-(D/E)XK nuclease family protein [Paenibacillus ihuae]
MNHNWFADLYEICNNDPFRRKILLVDHYDQGEQWLNRITKEHGPLLGVETETLRSLVMKRTKLELVKRGLHLLNRKQTFWVVQNLMVDMAERQDKYIPAEMITPGIVQSFHHAIEELRGAGFCASELSITFFEHEQKGLYITELLALYEQWLEHNHFTDFAGLLNYIPEVDRSVDNHLFIHRDMERFSAVEKEMLRRIAGDRVLILPQTGAFPSSLQNVDHVAVQLYHATGTLAEVREAFRRICSTNSSFDQAEIVVSNYEAYSEAIYTLSQALDIPCTFSQGLPVTYTKVGKAALVYLEWLECNYDVECLLKALRHDYISFHHFGAVDKADLILALEQSGIGWGRQRYSMLEAADNAELKGRHAEAIGLLNRAFKGLFQNLPDAHQVTWTPMMILHSLINLLEKHTVSSSEADSLVITELIDQMKLLEVVSPRTLSSETALRYVKDMVEGIRIFGSGPSCGKLHISSLQDGGISGRTHTYILGMSNEAWSLQLRQDPVLLDMERKSLDGLLLSTERTENIIRERETRLGLLSGQVTLSYSSYDPAEQKEIIPAFALLQAARIVTGDSQMDLTGLGQVLGRPVGYMSIDPNREHLLDGTDRWLGRFHTEGELKDGFSSLRQSFPFAAKLEQAEKRINEGTLSEYEGVLSTDTFTVSYLNNPEAYLSVTQLERYAECPKRFFFSQVLKLRAKETAEFDRSKWLDAASRGSLLHSIFYHYLKEMSAGPTNEGRLKHDEHRLQEITEQVIREYETKVPPPTPHIFHKECDSLRRDVAIFYQMEQKAEGRPRFFELELTIDGQPMSVMLDNGLVIRMKGFVDRVDEIGPHKYKIYDYKTGSPAKYDENEYFSQGTQLQHALYAVAVEQWLKHTGMDTEARVVESAYYFPTERGKGDEVSRVQNKTVELSELVGHLLASMESGTFTATTELKRCSYCDYGVVCKDESERTKAKWNLEPNTPLLHHIKEVERFG